MLKIANVSKQYAAVPIIQDIHLEFSKGAIIGLAGASGSGKSTLLRCIQSLETIDSGDIRYTGTSSFMFQDFQLFPHMTVLENLCYAPKQNKHSQNIEQEALQLLAQLGLTFKKDHYPAQLSGGQKQRVALARCLMMKPNILLCDEPTSGLDVATIEDVVNLLQAVHKLGVTMVIASHDLDFLTQIAERIIVLKAGRIAADIVVAECADPIHYLKNLYQESV